MALIDSYDETNQSNQWSTYSARSRVGFAVTISGSIVVSSIKFYLKKTGSPTGNATAVVYPCTGTPGTNGKGTGAVQATSGNFDVSTLTTAFQLIEFTFASPVSLPAGNWVFAVEYSGGDVSNYVLTGTDNSSPSDADQNTCYYTSSWLAGTDDTIFYLYGTPPVGGSAVNGVAPAKVDGVAQQLVNGV